MTAAVSRWTATHKGDRRGRELADRHYTRQTPGAASWTRPGFNFVLVAEDDQGGCAVFVWWRPKWEAGIERFDRIRAIECTIFRNETRYRSSDLIRDAIAALQSDDARRALRGEVAPPNGLITAINSAKTAKRRGKRSLPGECFRRAGFVEFEHAKSRRCDVWLRYVGAPE